MARRRKRYNRAELNHVTIGLIWLASSVNCLLAALVMHLQAKAVVALLIWGGVALVMSCVWLFSNPFKTGRPLSKMSDMITTAVVLLVVHAQLFGNCWPLTIAAALEAILLIRFYRSNLPPKEITA